MPRGRPAIGNCAACGCNQDQTQMWRYWGDPQKRYCSACGLWSREHHQVCPKSVWGERRKRSKTGRSKPHLRLSIKKSTPHTPPRSSPLSSPQPESSSPFPASVASDCASPNGGSSTMADEGEANDVEMEDDDEQVKDAALVLINISKSKCQRKRARHCFLDTRPSHFDSPKTPTIVLPPGWTRITRLPTSNASSSDNDESPRRLGRAIQATSPLSDVSDTLITPAITQAELPEKADDGKGPWRRGRDE